MGNSQVQDTHVISRAGSPYREKLCPRSWMYDPSRFGEGRAFKTKGKVFLDTDRPRPVNNILIFCYHLQKNKNWTVSYVVMCACQARVSAEKSEKNVSYGSKTDNLRYKPRKWCRVMSVLFLSFPYSHGGWTKLTTSQFVHSQNIFTDRQCLRVKFTNRVPTIRFQINLERDWALLATWFVVRVEFSKSWSEQSKWKVHDSNLEKILFTSVERGFPVKSSVQTARVLICLLKNCFTDVMNRMWNSLVCSAVFSYISSGPESYLAVRNPT